VARFPNIFTMFLFFSFLFQPPISRAQGGNVNVPAGTGSIPLSSEIEFAPGVSVNVATSNVRLDIPIRSKDGKIPFSYDLVANSSMFVGPSTTGGSSYENPMRLEGVSGFSNIPTYQVSLVGGCQWPNEQISYCISAPQPSLNYQVTGGGTTCNWYFLDATQALHNFPSETNSGGNCPIGTWVTQDGSGITLNTTNTHIQTRSGDVATNTEVFSSNTCSGIHLPISGTHTFADPDNLQILEQWNWATPPSGCTPGTGLQQTFSDQSGSGVNLMTVAAANLQNQGTQNLKSTYTYTDGTGKLETYTVKYQAYHVHTYFSQCSPGDIGNSALGVSYLPYEIDRPDGTTWGITYETNGDGSVTSRIASITLPTGGSVSFVYTSTTGSAQQKQGLDCNSNVVPVMHVTTNDNNGNISTWVITNTNDSAGNSGPNDYTVTIEDPLQNYSKKWFNGTFITQEQKAAGSSTLLSQTLVCYNHNYQGCAQPNIAIEFPIFQMYTLQFPVISGVVQNPSITETVFDNESFTTVVPPSRTGHDHTV